MIFTAGIRLPQVARAAETTNTARRNLFADNGNRVVIAHDRAYHQFNTNRYILIDKDGKEIAWFSNHCIGDGLYIYYSEENGVILKGIIDTDGNVIIKPNDTYGIGDVVDGLFTISDGYNEYSIYNTKGELVKKIKEPMGFNYYSGGYNGKSYGIQEISGTNLIVREHTGNMVGGCHPEEDWFIIRLMSEKKAADEFIKIKALPNGEFTAVGAKDLKGYILNKDGSIKLKTNYGELIYIDENRFKALEKYHVNTAECEKDNRSCDICDIIDGNGNILKKSVKNENIKKRAESENKTSIYEARNYIKKDKNYYIAESNGTKQLVDSNGNIIKTLLENIGGDLFTFMEDGKKGVIDINGNIIVRPKYADYSKAGFVVDGRFTIREGNRYDVYVDNGEFVKSIEKPIGFDINGTDGKVYDISEISDTNVVVFERSDGPDLSRNWFIIRLMAETKTADNCFKIRALPDGRFTAICVDDMKACILARNGRIITKTNYGELVYIRENLYAAFEKYSPSFDRINSGEKYIYVNDEGNVVGDEKCN